MNIKEKRALVIGGSRGIGRGITMALAGVGASVSVSARPSEALRTLVAKGIATHAGDATDPTLAGRLLDEVEPDIVVLTVGAIPLMRPIDRFDWEAFSTHWQTDTKATFHLLREALGRPLQRNARVIVFSSGAALGGSPLSGGYASAKQAQRYLCTYARKEVEDRELGFNVQCILPSLNINTRLGATGVRGYAARAGMDMETFARDNLPTGLTPEIAGTEIVKVLVDNTLAATAEFMLTGDGLTPQN